MPHERNEERRRGIGFQEVLKSIREPFLTLVFSRNDCSQILEIFFSPFFSPLSLFFSRDPLRGFAYRNYFANFITRVFPIFFYFFNILCYLRIFRFFISSPKRRVKINEFESCSKSISKMIPRRYYPHVESFSFPRRAVSRRAEPTKQTMTNHSFKYASEEQRMKHS